MKRLALSPDTNVHSVTAAGSIYEKCQGVVDVRINKIRHKKLRSTGDEREMKQHSEHDCPGLKLIHAIFSLGLRALV